MGAKTRRDVPARLEGLRRRFERWRRTRKERTRIPEPLWASAAKLAGTYGIHRTAKVLRVDYYALKGTIDFRREHMRADLWVRDAPRMSGKDCETCLDL